MPLRFTLPSNTCICRDLNCQIPFGLCHCGCGGRTNICDHDYPRLRQVNGEPYRFIFGHHALGRLPIEDALPFKLDGDYCRLIPLTRGFYAIVWESDYYWLMEWKWCAKWNRCTKSYYAVRSGPRNNKIFKSFYMHRQIMGVEPDDHRTVDHAFHNTLDNRRKINWKDNLRIATMEEQARNRRVQTTNTSGYKGVSFNKKLQKWKSYIRVDGKIKHLGVFLKKEEAYAAYCAAAKLYYGEFACLG